MSTCFSLVPYSRGRGPFPQLIGEYLLGDARCLSHYLAKNLFYPAIARVLFRPPLATIETVAYRRHPQRNIILTGFYCSGTERVGRELARRMRRPFFDVTSEIKRRERLARFKLPGTGPVPSSRKLEEWVIRDLAYRREAVVTLGLDTLANETNFEELQVFSYIVFIDPPFAVLWDRIQQDSAFAELVQEQGREGFHELWLELRASYELCNLQLFGALDQPARLSKLIAHCFYT